ncbi:unnamed protein product [Arabis nemorensis]|uniref:Uncharacterized protein n=1 Tax=Arabis nemorensis TaxID=586526 RepID=A0A565CHS4_9BRAS|nr:unnamed protein product [Arabis nemorensis]
MKTRHVVLELIIGLALCMWAALTFPGKFLSIHPDSDENRNSSSRDVLRVLTLMSVMNWKVDSIP